MNKAIARVLAVATMVCASAASATDVGVSIGISQPGVHGRIDIGRFPQPAVIVAQPVIIQPVTVVQPVQPVYVWVPLDHRKNWRKHCRQYNACGVPVYFVRHDWYDQHVMAEHRGKGHGKGHGKDHGRGKGKHD